AARCVPVAHRAKTVVCLWATGVNRSWLLGVLSALIGGVSTPIVSARQRFLLLSAWGYDLRAAGRRWWVADLAIACSAIHYLQALRASCCYQGGEAGGLAAPGPLGGLGPQGPREPGGFLCPGAAPVV